MTQQSTYFPVVPLEVTCGDIIVSMLDCSQGSVDYLQVSDREIGAVVGTAPFHSYKNMLQELRI